MSTFASGRVFSGVAVDPAGSVYLADNLTYSITKMAGSAGVRLAGTGAAGAVDGTGTSAGFGFIGGLAIGPDGALYVADTGNSRIRKVTADGTVSTLAGSAAGYSDGPGTTAQFNAPAQIAVDPSGNVYVSDTRNHRIRKVSPGGLVVTVAGGGDPDIDLGDFADGAGPSARFSQPSGIVVDASGTLYVADRRNNRIRKIEP